MIRRFVHLIVADLKSASYTLRKIDTLPLFADVRKDLGMQTARLPRPVLCFDTPDKNEQQTEFFFLGPDMRHWKGFNPAWAALQGKLYLANASDDDYNKPCFEALRFDVKKKDWFWDLLPMPPFSNLPFRSRSLISSFAAAGDDKNIWISTLKDGTYTFDITTAAWCKEGDWTLPFAGQMQYIPDYNLCFGFCKGSKNLCTADLIAGALEPPVHKDVWEDVDGYNGAKGWHLACSHLTYLGSGRFCITRFYDTRKHDCYVPLCDIAVMTAVEVKHSSSAGELQVTKGASRCYKFASGSTLSGWVF